MDEAAAAARTEPTAAVQAAVASASAHLVEREVLVELVALAAIAGEHVLVVGPPGTAKSEAVRRIAGALGGRYFEYLLGRFTEPSELFGPVDLRRLKEGVVETEISGMLPEAELAFLDEIFLGSTAILNTLLGLLNERVFRRGKQAIPCPLRVCVAACNTIPEDEALAAFADRFLLHVFLEPIPDPRIEELLERGWAGRGAEERAQATVADLDALSQRARAQDLDQVRPKLAHAVRALRRAGMSLSDRRAVKMQSLVAAASALAGRDAATAADLWPIVYALPSEDEQLEAREVLQPALEGSASEALPAAALDASLGPAARAVDIRRRAEAALTEAPEPGADEEAMRSWTLRLEGLAREIDASFEPSSRPEALDAARAEVVAALDARRTVPPAPNAP